MNIKQEIINNHKNLGFKINEKGYVNTATENLIKSCTNWSEIQNELINGDGNELKIKNNKLPKFQAVHSSCALCVNNFAPIKQNINKIKLFKTKGFDEAIFEKRLSTGISTPNLDFYLSNKYEVIGFESKFTELLSPKLPNTNLEKYVKIKNLPKDIIELIKYYINCNDKMYLDVAQLIKHAIGLINARLENSIKTSKLVYLYWVPINWADINIYRRHVIELMGFTEQIRQFIDFKSFSYIEFWELMGQNNILEDHIKKMKERYYFAINANKI